MATERTAARLVDLAQTLIQRTMQRKIKWKATDEPTTFLYTGQAASISIESVDKDGRAPYRMAILDSKGVEVEALEAEWGYDEGDRFAVPGRINDALADLYDVARGSALNIDQVIDSMIEELGPDEPF